MTKFTSVLDSVYNRVHHELELRIIEVHTRLSTSKDRIVDDVNFTHDIAYRPCTDMLMILLYKLYFDKEVQYNKTRKLETLQKLLLQKLLSKITLSTIVAEIPRLKFPVTTCISKVSVMPSPGCRAVTSNEGRSSTLSYFPELRLI